MFLKIQQKLHCLGCISKQTISWWKASIPPQKENWTFFWTFFLHFLSFSCNGVFLTLKCRTLVLEPLHGDRAAAISICWKWISFTKVSKYGKKEHSRALNASYTFQPQYEFLIQVNRCGAASSPGSSRFAIWRRKERRPWHTAEITWPIYPRKVEIYSKWRPR